MSRVQSPASKVQGPTIAARVQEFRCAIIRIVNASFVQSNFRSFCYASYKQFIWWIYRRLGKNNRRVIPSCALWKIRESFPEESGNYVPDCEGEKD